MCWVHQCHSCWQVVFVDRPCPGYNYGQIPGPGSHCGVNHCVGSLRDAYYGGQVYSKQCPFCGAHVDDPNRIV